MNTPSWVHPLFQALDAGDTTTFASFLTDDVVFKFANSAPIQGKEAVRNAVAAFLASIKAIRHDVLETWDHPHTVVCHGTVTYTRQDTSQLTVPFANIFKMHQGLIKDYLIYVDASELYQTAPQS